ncbi:MAG: hypothetical protein ISQ92_01935 [Pelagibacteraceae bacterium]|jgi:hypothetical protein|nr:hypothetical protein [Pelagibacteraceae bacterium]
MKFFYLLAFFLLVSCVSTKKTYLCGNRECLDKKEFNEYFSENLSVELMSNNKKSKKTIDLVKLNTEKRTPKKKNSLFKPNDILDNQGEKEKLRMEKKRLLQERKIKKAKLKLKRKEEKKRIKDMKSNKIVKKKDKFQTTTQQNKRSSNKELIKKNDKYLTKEEITNNTLVNKNIKSVCDKIEDCDIDTISEILTKKGKNKPFPNIASN